LSVQLTPFFYHFCPDITETLYADVSKQLGHGSVKLTLDVYYHWMPGSKKSKVDGLDDVIVAPACTPAAPLAINEGLRVGQAI
jgi:hypothetical protein